MHEDRTNIEMEMIDGRIKGKQTKNVTRLHYILQKPKKVTSCNFYNVSFLLEIQFPIWEFEINLIRVMEFYYRNIKLI